ncbi:hypothetical protein [Limosilactobacillus oris]|uniref:hypothetical protein n=1 Tax=Limosilactobacillus oris TaxID=1632 RepID=UPI001D168B2C|nr:hypothetical protein [Limosilactobacillus oris]
MTIHIFTNRCALDRVTTQPVARLVTIANRLSVLLVVPNTIPGHQRNRVRRFLGQQGDR